MHLVVVHKSFELNENRSDSLLRMALASKPLKNIVFSKITDGYGWDKEFVLAIPSEWKGGEGAADTKIMFYEDKVTLPANRQSQKQVAWFVISNGGFLTQADPNLLLNAVTKTNADIVAVNVEPNLRAGSEKVLKDNSGNLVGFRPLYADAVKPALIPKDWPHHLFISPAGFERLMVDGSLPASFTELVDRCLSDSVTIRSINVGGSVLDLNTERGLLMLLSGGLMTKRNRRLYGSNGIDMPASARMFGEVALGKNVNIGENVIIAGPAVIGDGVRVGDSAVVHECIVGPGVVVPPGVCIQNRVITDSSQISGQNGAAAKTKSPTDACSGLSGGEFTRSRFRTWPLYSYARFVKRIADIIIAAFVIFIFIPVLPFIALAVKLGSGGPVFFRDIRQGLHGKTFNCLKFRTMRVGSDEIQEKLRVINEADGPQFVIANDPRISAVGRFLRETYLDEVPQFFNVLLGQMSIVGPRPSPEDENIMCPFWRDARLSVRPGVTGLWQVMRTRQPMRDFQEWIHYDVEYARNLSMGLDLWICWRTFKKMLMNFIRQF